MFRVTFDSIYSVGKLVGYNVLYNTKTNRRKLLIQRTFITIHVIMALLSAARVTYWAITREAIPISVSGIEIVFRLESRCLTPVFNLIYLYKHQSKYFQIGKVTRTYFDSLSPAQKNGFRWTYWLGLLVQSAVVASDMFFFVVWTDVIYEEHDFISHTMDIISIFYSTLWYIAPMFQYFLIMDVLARSLHKSCSQLHRDTLDTIRLQAIALNIRSVINLCELVGDYYGIAVLLGLMCACLDFVFYPYIYVYATYFLKRSLGRFEKDLLFVSISFGSLINLANMFLIFMVCETIYRKKRNIKDRLHDLLRMTKQDGRLYREVYYLSLRYTNQDDKISAAGCLTLTYKQLTSIITTGVAFLILQIKFMIRDLE